MEFAQACIVIATALTTRVQGSIVEHQQIQTAWAKAAPKCQEEVNKAVKKAQDDQAKAQKEAKAAEAKAAKGK